MRISYIFASAAFLSLASAAFQPTVGGQSVNAARLRARYNFKRDSDDTQALPPNVVQAFFTQPLDHFDNSSTATFKQRFWFSNRHYVAGGPVVVLDGGETSGTDRLPFLDTGIVDILTQATGGLGVILEHRYYGTSVPVLNFTTDSLRWLNNEQALADSAKFLAEVKFDGIDADLTAPNTPWIYYGGSYAGARAAHMKVTYPDLVYGAIASSGVTHAAVLDWEYFDIIRKAAEPACSSALVNSIKTIDQRLSDKTQATPLKTLFGLQNLIHVQDFASLLTFPLGAWQNKNWANDPAEDDFDAFCTALTQPPAGKTQVAQLPFGDSARQVAVPGGKSVDYEVANYASYINTNYVKTCGTNVEGCFGTFNDTQYSSETSLSDTWRLWTFQVCTQWGYFMTAPPSNVPRIVSNFLDLNYTSMICRQAYPPGQFFTVPKLPDVASTNAFGDFAIAADRLAIIDGEIDPWRPDTPHSQYAKDRDDTITRPFKLIPGAVHHWDENGVANRTGEPPEIKTIHDQEIEFVKAWLEDFKKPGNGK